jgi:hypothetical protein
MKHLTGNIYDLEDGRMFDVSTGKWFIADSSLLKYHCFYTEKGSYLPFLDSLRKFQGERDGFTCVIKFLCLNTFFKGKTEYANLITKGSDNFIYPVKGNRKIQGDWVKFDIDIKKDNAYLACITKKNKYPERFQIIKLIEGKL